jgi:hypothetical protein
MKDVENRIKDNQEKKGLTYEEHVEIGNRLKEIHDYIIKLDVKLSNSYAKKFNDLRCPANWAGTAHGAIGCLRSSLDDAICREFPNKPNEEVLSVYYGRREREIMK